MNPILASILIFAGNFAPQGWAFCNGQLLAINQNQALFSLLGTTYGGDGITNLSNYVLGQPGGSENTTLLLNNVPIHNHPLHATSEAGTTSAPAGAYLGNTGALDREYNISGTVVSMNAGAIGTAGGSQPFNNLQPYLALNFIIALQGIFPSRN
jgi:microcystin-dependent protein